MSTLRRITSALALVALVAAASAAWAHQMTIKGTVAAIEPKRIQVKTGEEPKGQAPAWYPLDAKTKITRGKTTLTLENAKIAVGERVVAIVDHQANGTMTTLELRLAAAR
jgi:methionine-rich copper-binding protein CopC